MLNHYLWLLNTNLCYMTSFLLKDDAGVEEIKPNPQQPFRRKLVTASRRKFCSYRSCCKERKTPPQPFSRNLVTASCRKFCKHRCSCTERKKTFYCVKSLPVAAQYCYVLYDKFPSEGRRWCEI